MTPILTSRAQAWATLKIPSALRDAADPVDTLYFPPSHAVHVPPTGPVDPALQVHFVKAELPTGELEFDVHALHVELAEAPTAVE